MIKILFFIEKLGGGGAEKVLCDLVNHMDFDKFDITVATVWPYEAEKYLIPRIRYKSLYPKFNSLFKMVYRLEAALGLSYRLHLKDEYDIECAYLEAAPTKILASSNNKAALKLAWVHCDLKNTTDNPEALAEHTENWYSKYDEIICVSDTVKIGFDEMFHHKFPSRVLHNVVDDEIIRRKASFPCSKSFMRPLVVSLGSLYYPKNYMRLLKVHKQLLEEGFMHDLWILGEGVDRPLLEKYIMENGIGKTVHLPGFIDNPYPYLREADLIVCSSIYEGFSTFITEGLILGKAIVTTECSGMRELLGDSEFGIITENSDSGLYEGMKRMLRDAELRDQYAVKAAERGKIFSMHNLVSQTEQYFENALINHR